MHDIAYIVASIFFILGLKRLGSAATARQGNLLSSIGMAIAVVATLINQGLAWPLILGGFVVGGGIGAVAAKRVQMTGMPEMVALFNGSGGIASLLVGLASQLSTAQPVEGAGMMIPMSRILLEVMIDLRSPGTRVAACRLINSIAWGRRWTKKVTPLRPRHSDFSRCVAVGSQRF